MEYVANEPENVKNRAAGFVIARFNKKDRTITAECWPRDADLSKPGAKQFKGWPKVIKQVDNYNPASWGKGGELTFDKENPVVQVAEKGGDVLYTIRIKGNKFTPHLPKGKAFIIKAGLKNPDKTVVEDAKAGGAATSVSVQ